MNDATHHAKQTAVPSPGPFTVSRSETKEPWSIVSAEGMQVARVAHEVDANLFASAPELLAALWRTVGELEYAAEKLPQSNAREALQRVRAAIASAGGVR